MSIQSPSYLIGRSGAGDLAEERMTAEERGENTPLRNGGENTPLRNGGENTPLRNGPSPLLVAHPLVREIAPPSGAARRPAIIASCPSTLAYLPRPRTRSRSE
jgi:hypothetical protein